MKRDKQRILSALMVFLFLFILIQPTISQNDNFPEEKTENIEELREFKEGKKNEFNYNHFDVLFTEEKQSLESAKYLVLLNNIIHSIDKIKWCPFYILYCSLKTYF